MLPDSLVLELRWLRGGGANDSTSIVDEIGLVNTEGGLMATSSVELEVTEDDGSPGLGKSEDANFCLLLDETRFKADENDHFLFIILGRPAALLVPVAGISNESAEVTDNTGLLSEVKISDSASTINVGEDAELASRPACAIGTVR